MDESEFEASEFRIAYNDWAAYMRQVLQYNANVRSLIRTYLPPVAGVQRILGRTPLKSHARVVRVGRSVSAGKTELASGFSFTHAVTLMAVWGAFEAFVADGCKAQLLLHPELVETKPFESARVPASLLFKDRRDRVAALYDHAVVRLRSDVRQGDKTPLIGIAKIEAQLKIVGLGNRGHDISDELGQAILHAQQSRHVWAHRAGKADEQFIKNCPMITTEVGKIIQITQEQNDLYCYALIVYGLLINNRFREAHDLAPEPFPWDRNVPFADPYANLWGVSD
ncbi:hypothetical protein [Mycobacterium sp. SMC-17]|uniref:hypothetical protein n=1 Tax=Mycobacterium sp. SMC-17 TaxID=3381628 RepID=UPI00387635A7